jgi:hypothetical protein
MLLSWVSKIALTLLTTVDTRTQRSQKLPSRLLLIFVIPHLLVVPPLVFIVANKATISIGKIVSIWAEDDVVLVADGKYMNANTFLIAAEAFD